MSFPDSINFGIECILPLYDVLKLPIFLCYLQVSPLEFLSQLLELPKLSVFFGLIVYRVLL